MFRGDASRGTPEARVSRSQSSSRERPCGEEKQHTSCKIISVMTRGGHEDWGYHIPEVLISRASFGCRTTYHLCEIPLVVPRGYRKPKVVLVAVSPGRLIRVYQLQAAVYFGTRGARAPPMIADDTCAVSRLFYKPTTTCVYHADGFHK